MLIAGPFFLLPSVAEPNPFALGGDVRSSDSNEGGTFGKSQNPAYIGSVLGHQITFPATVLDNQQGPLMVSIEGRELAGFAKVYLHGVSAEETLAG